MDLYRIEGCRGKDGCPRGVGDTKALEEKLEEVFNRTNFTKQRKNQLKDVYKQHDIFRIGLAGCANCCSQPQIKDFALIAKALPQIDHVKCTLCGCCSDVCKEQALSIINGQLQLNSANCLGCGDCWRVCPVGALNPSEVTWRLLIGGKLGRHPQLAREIGEVSIDEGVNNLERSIEEILNAPNPTERIAQILTNGN